MSESQKVSHGTLGYAVWSIRNRLGPGTTQKDFARMVGIDSPSAVSRWERNERVPSNPALQRLLELAVTPEETEPIRKLLGADADSVPVKIGWAKSERMLLKEWFLEQADGIRQSVPLSEKLAPIRQVAMVLDKGGPEARMIEEVVHSVMRPSRKSEFLTTRLLQFLAQATPAERERLAAVIEGDYAAPESDPGIDDAKPKTAKEQRLVELLLRALRDPDDFGSSLVVTALEGYDEMTRRLAEIEARGESQTVSSTPRKTMPVEIIEDEPEPEYTEAPTTPAQPRRKKRA